MKTLLLPFLGLLLIAPTSGPAQAGVPGLDPKIYSGLRIRMRRLRRPHQERTPPLFASRRSTYRTSSGPGSQRLGETQLRIRTRSQHSSHNTRCWSIDAFRTSYVCFWSCAVNVASFPQLQHLYSRSSYFDVKKSETDRLLFSDHWRGSAGMTDLRRAGMAEALLCQR